MNAALTHIGTACVLLEVGPLRLLTDPVFDPPGGRYSFGYGTGAIKLTGPSIKPDDLGGIDLADVLRHREASWLPARADSVGGPCLIVAASDAQKLRGDKVRHLVQAACQMALLRFGGHETQRHWRVPSPRPGAPSSPSAIFPAAATLPTHRSH